MKGWLTNVLFIALIVHVIISFFIILDLPFLRNFRPLTIYRTYLLPGPFFNDSKIIDNHSLCVSWKVNGKWSEVIDPAEEKFNRYHSTLNPTDLYRTRMSRGVQLISSDSSEVDSNSKEFATLKQFLSDYYISKEADSVRIWLINKRVKNFGIRKDSVQVTFSR